MPIKEFSKNFAYLIQMRCTHTWKYGSLPWLSTSGSPYTLLMCTPHRFYPTSARPSTSKILEIGRHVEQAFACNSIAMKS